MKAEAQFTKSRVKRLVELEKENTKVGSAGGKPVIRSIFQAQEIEVEKEPASGDME